MDVIQASRMLILLGGALMAVSTLTALLSLRGGNINGWRDLGPLYLAANAAEAGIRGSLVFFPKNETSTLLRNTYDQMKRNKLEVATLFELATKNNNLYVVLYRVVAMVAAALLTYYSMESIFMSWLKRRSEAIVPPPSTTGNLQQSKTGETTTSADVPASSRSSSNYARTLAIWSLIFLVIGMSGAGISHVASTTTEPLDKPFTIAQVLQSGSPGPCGPGDAVVTLLLLRRILSLGSSSSSAETRSPEEKEKARNALTTMATIRTLAALCAFAGVHLELHRALAPTIPRRVFYYSSGIQTVCYMLMFPRSWFLRRSPTAIFFVLFIALGTISFAAVTILQRDESMRTLLGLRVGHIGAMATRGTELITGASFIVLCLIIFSGGSHGFVAFFATSYFVMRRHGVRDFMR